VVGRDGRKILLLTATPFNNHIGDIHAQVGHFAKAQTWEGLRKALLDPPQGAEQGRGREVGLDEALAQAIIARVELDHGLGDPYWQSPDQRAHFEALLALCSREAGGLGAHFESSRALDLNEESVTRQGEKGIDATARATTDTGPVYQWGGADFSSELDTLFRVVADALGEQEQRYLGGGRDRGQRAVEDRLLPVRLRGPALASPDHRRAFAHGGGKGGGEADVPGSGRASPSPPSDEPGPSLGQDSLDRAFLDALYQVFRPAQRGR
jgi:hypothetical protein